MSSTNKPFLLKPAAKDYLWGGSRLNDDFGKQIPLAPLAETWECSTHPDGESTVAETGEQLSAVLEKHPEYLGTHPLQITGGKPELPILIKLIDARENLSVQVHPDDDFAMRHENSLGKTEMWYVLAAKKGATLVYGFNRDMSPELVRTALREKRIERFLNHLDVKKDDVFYLEAGTVHAVGGGVLLAEVQESSNLTYRLYDYDRVDRDGKQRALQVEKALQVAKLTASSMPRQPMRVLRYKKGCAIELLSRCRYFQVERILLNTEGRKMPAFKTDSNSFHTLLCTEGCGVLFGDAFMLNFFKGDCIFVPAESIPMKVHGKAQILNISC